jgi:hypothetical protein
MNEAEPGFLGQIYRQVQTMFTIAVTILTGIASPCAILYRKGIKNPVDTCKVADSF